MPDAPPHVIRLATIDSTSAEARRRVRAGAAVDGLALAAAEQTAGRGRRGTRWVMLPERSLAFTFVRPRPAGVRASTLMARLTVAVCRGLESAGADELAIKWPNDILRGARKAGGLLVEIVADPTGREWLLLGLGCNLCLQSGDLPQELAAHAGDLGLPPGPAAADRALAGVVAEFDRALAELGTPADAERGAEYVRRSWIVGRQASLEHRGQRIVTRVAEVSPDGDLRTAEALLLQAEHVHVLEVEGLA